MELSILKFIAELGVPQFIMLMVFLVITWRLGMFKKNGNGNGYQKQIDELHAHAEVANNEMGEIKEMFEKKDRQDFEHRVKEEKWQEESLALLKEIRDNKKT